MQDVDDFAAPVDERLEDLLHRGGLRGPCPETDDREVLPRRRDGPLDENSARLLKCAERV
jgi:hypothetical protein